MICVITNQAGIGRGFYSEADFNVLTDWMCEQFRMEGVKISNVYFSPYHPSHGVGIYRKDDISRKPNPGMIQQAAAEFDINLRKSVLIGDKLSDIQAGVNAGVGTNLYIGCNKLCCDVGLTCDWVTSLREAEKFL